MRHLRYLLLTVSLVLLSSCIPDPLDLALSGKLADDESNAVIIDYCQTCHIHRTFEAADHAPRMHALYDREPFTAAMQCRTCHLVGENTWGMKSRKTIFPADAARSRAAAPRRHGARPGIVRRVANWLTPAWLRPASEAGPDTEAAAQDGLE